MDNFGQALECPLWRLATAVLIALVASITIAACGGSSPSGSGAASTPNTGLKYAACIRGHGAPDYPDPSSGTSGESIDGSQDKISINGRTLAESPQVVQTAMNKCEKYSPTTQGSRTSAAQLAKIRTEDAPERALAGVALLVVAVFPVILMNERDHPAHRTLESSDSPGPISLMCSDGPCLARRRSRVPWEEG